MDSIQAIRNKAKQAEAVQQFTDIASESHTETQRRTWRDAYNLYERYAAISTPEQWQTLADSCNALANTGTLGKHLAMAIFDALAEIRRGQTTYPAPPV